MTTFTREDFEHAARAAGLVVESFYPHYGAVCVGLDRFWNPPKDDGDALRLAVKLNFNVCKREHEVEIFNDDNGEFLCSISISEGDDPYAATRYAIFRAAIVIGKAMLEPDVRPNADGAASSPSVAAPDQQTTTLFHPNEMPDSHDPI